MPTPVVVRPAPRQVTINVTGARGPAGEPGATTIEGIDGLQDALDAKADASDLDGYVPVSQRGAANGVASLGSDGKVPSGQVPDLAAMYMLRGIFRMVKASGDTSGVTDTAAIQAQLTSARESGGGIVVLEPSIFYINNTLLQGSYTTFLLHGAEVRLVAGSNCLMLANYSSMNMVASFEIIADPGANFFTTGDSDTSAIFAVMARGQSIDVPMRFGSATTTRMVATIKDPLSSGSDRTFSVNRTVPSSMAGWAVGRLWNRDVGIKVFGGIWNRQDNGSGDVETNHVMRFRGFDDLHIADVTFESTGYNFTNGRYAILVQNFTNARFERVAYGRTPGEAGWQLGSFSGYTRDGIHVTGPASNIVIRDCFGSAGDDMVAITTSDYENIAGNYAGDVENVVIENTQATLAGQCSVKILAGPAQTVRDVTVRGVFGKSQSANGMVTIGDDSRQVTTRGGTYDRITVEDVLGNPSNNPLVTLIGDLGHITLKNLFYDGNVSTGALGAVVIGPNLFGTPVPTTIDHLVIEGLDARNLAPNKAVFVESGSTVTKLTARGWFGAAPADQIGGTGTVTTLLEAN